MKKFVLLILLIMPVIASAQDDMYIHGGSNKSKVSIVKDVVDSKGNRVIISNTKVFASPKDEGYLSYGCTASKLLNDTILSVKVRIVSQLSLKIRKNMMLLMKTFKGTTFSLSAEYDNEDIFTDKDGYYDTSVTYAISDEDMELLRHEGLAKIRVETEYNNFDKEYKDNKAGEYIVACYDLVKSEMRKQKSFMDGF